MTRPTPKPRRGAARSTITRYAGPATASAAAIKARRLADLRDGVDRPLCLDLYCGAGGAGMGYWLAGFDVEGVDAAPQPHYPFAFTRGDAIETLERRLSDAGHRIELVHASPPCQGYTWATPKARREAFPLDHIERIREICDEYAVPHVIENTLEADTVHHQIRRPKFYACEADALADRGGIEVQRPIILCGQMFGLPVIRHRVFEVGPMVNPRPHVKHVGTAAGGEIVTVAGHGPGNKPGNSSIAAWRRAMGMPWAATRDELAQAIPPAYTEYIGREVMGWL